MKFYAAVYFRNLLAEQLEVAEDDLLSAAADGPMYGPIYVLRYALCNHYNVIGQAVLYLRFSLFSYVLQVLV